MNSHFNFSVETYRFTFTKGGKKKKERKKACIINIHFSCHGRSTLLVHGADEASQKFLQAIILEKRLE